EDEEAAPDDSSCGRTSAPVIRLPLDGAAHRRHKGGGRLLAGEDRVEDLAHHLLLHAFRFLRVVELPAVSQLPGGVEHEEVGRAHRTVRLRDLLALVSEVREVVSFPLRAFDHVREVVFRIALVVVRVDHDELHALSRVIALDGDRPFLPRLHVRAVIAPKGYGEDRLVAEGSERVCFPIDGGQREVRSRRSDRKSFVLHELQRTTVLTYSCGRYRLSLASSGSAWPRRALVRAGSPISRHKLYHRPAGWSIPVIA